MRYKKGIGVAAVLAVGIVAVVWLVIPARESGDPEQRAMRALVARLANANMHQVRLFGEPVIYTFEADTTVRAEVLAQGKKIVPYLIEGLHSSNEDVSGECAVMLGRIPTKRGVKAMIDRLGDGEAPKSLLWGSQIGLHHATGYSTLLTPGRDISQPNREEMRDLWKAWWKDNKDWLVETEEGLAIRDDDGTVVAISIKVED